MKNLIAILTCVLTSLTLSAQKQEFNPPYFVNGIRLDSLEGPYLHVTTVGVKLFKHAFKMCIDYGQDQKIGISDSVLRNKKDEDIIFNSDMQIINFMYKNGYEYIDTNISVSDGTSTTFYKFKKK